jgi:hypothetical protein
MKGRKSQMTIAQLRQLTKDLPEDTILLVEQEDVLDVETINIQIHSDGRCHLIFSTEE